MTANLQLASERIPTDRQSLAVQGFFGIMTHWNVDNNTARVILGSPAERTYFEWKRGKVSRVSSDTLRRIGYVAGIWKALQIIYSNPEHADTWVRRPNRAFGNQTPLARMAAGDVTDLAAVREYVDAARAPWS
jgi:uncharacterized protein (DUF2384 family)